ncbi:MAG: NAD(P)H-dependent glycerol-3-phosphate dehydrogenase [Alicyclobacillus sp.]|nr:NAD(P)H-dependent glycerol-3-phosphate dehydrogenase [Alicyclobacillus sp.]
MLCDSHCHLNDQRFADDLAQVLERAGAAGVTHILVPGVDVPTSERAIAIAEAHEGVYAAIGIHPEAAAAVTDGDWERIEALARHPKVAAIGEIGLDYYWDAAPRDVQQAVLRRQLRLARDLGLPVSIHNRDATQDTVCILEAEAKGGPGGVMHCFTGDWAAAQRCISAGFAISFGGMVTFAKADAVREVCHLLPETCLVLMTTKGLEPGTSLMMSEVLLQVRPGVLPAVMSGPNLGVEIARGVPTATVVAATDVEVAEAAAEPVRAKSLRVYTGTDVVGVQMGGVLKNVLAVGAGISDGLGFGDNTKASMLARGLYEMSLLGCALGGCKETFMGLSGFGDLIATAVSPLSRNYHVGYELAKGKSLGEVRASMKQVAEGIDTAIAAYRLVGKLRLKAPIIDLVYSVLFESLPPAEVARRFTDGLRPDMVL